MVKMINFFLILKLLFSLLVVFLSFFFFFFFPVVCFPFNGHPLIQKPRLL